MMNGWKPNSPIMGRQEDVRNNSLRDRVLKIGFDLWNKANAMMKRIRLEKIVASSISLLAKMSSNLLSIFFLS